MRVSDLRLLVSLGENARQIGTDDTTLVLDGLSRSLLGDLLGNTLLVYSSEYDGPCDLSGVLSLQEERLLLGGDESERLGVGLDVKLSLSFKIVMSCPFVLRRRGAEKRTFPG